MSLTTTVNGAISTVKSTVSNVTSIGSKIITFCAKHWKFFLVVLVVLGVGYGINHIFSSIVIANLQKDMRTLQATNTAIAGIASDWANKNEQENTLNQQLESENTVLKSALAQSQTQIINIKKLLLQSNTDATDIGKDINNVKKIISGVADEIGKVIQGAK